MEERSGVRWFARIGLLSLACVAAGPALACTALATDVAGETVVMKSYDWRTDAGLLVLNKRGVAKHSVLVVSGGAPTEWTSRFASATFNQYGRGLPQGGMNEAGLVVEILWLSKARFPEPDGRPVLNELQWIQFQLDNYATVAEMVENAHAVGVSPLYGRVHYFACDARGECAAFEYVRGHLFVTHGPALEYRALANDLFARSNWYRGEVDAGRADSRGSDSLSRFVRASRMSATSHEAADIAGAAFPMLERVRTPYTQWQVVYVPQRQRIYFRTRSAHEIKSVDLGRVDPGCDATVEVLDLVAPGRGDMTDRLLDYEPAMNARLLDETLGRLAGHLPKGAVSAAMGYPETLQCASSERAVERSRLSPAPERERTDGP